MTTLELTPSIIEEVKKSINDFDRLIKKEMAFSVDLRNHDKIVMYTNQIIRLQKSLLDGKI